MLTSLRACLGLFLATAIVATAWAVTPAYAEGGGDDGGSDSDSDSGDRDRDRDRDRGRNWNRGGDDAGGGFACPDGWQVEVDEETEEASCVRESSLRRDELPAIGWGGVDGDFVEAAVLAHSGEFERAVDAFTALDQPDDPYVLNYLGFANRKLGNTEDALAYYHRALSIRPDYVRARAYLGEGYVALGRIDEAREQLALIAEECGTACDEYRTLETTIAAHLAISNG